MGSRRFRGLKKKLAYRVLPLFPPVGRLFIRILAGTVRTRLIGKEAVFGMLADKRPFFFAFFHGRQFLLVDAFKGRPIAIMTSVSFIGEIQARILRGLGFRTVRGSSTRGGSRVLAQMVRLVRQRGAGAFAVDGPSGPGGVVKPGVIYAAGKLGVPIIPLTTSARPSILFRKTWDRYLLPLPFSRGVVLFGDPWFPSEDRGQKGLSSDCRELQGILRDLEKKADALTGKKKG